MDYRILKNSKKPTPKLQVISSLTSLNKTITKN